MADQQTLAAYGGSELDNHADADLTRTPESESTTTTSDRTRRKDNADALCDALETIDGVEEVLVDDASPKTWQSVRLAIILPGTMGWATPMERGVNLDDTVNLRSIAQRINNIISDDDHVSAFEVIDRPEKMTDTYHDSTLYLVDIWYP